MYNRVNSIISNCTAFGIKGCPISSILANSNDIWHSGIRYLRTKISDQAVSVNFVPCLDYVTRLVLQNIAQKYNSQIVKN